MSIATRKENDENIFRDDSSALHFGFVGRLSQRDYEGNRFRYFEARRQYAEVTDKENKGEKMNSPTKVVLTAFVLGIVIMGLNRLSRQDKNSIATIERQEASGRITSTQASMEKDSIARDHIFKF